MSEINQVDVDGVLHDIHDKRIDGLDTELIESSKLLVRFA